ncbi:MAG: hypothetical protein ABIP94_09950 [Planctomycetota bacterium]
MSEVGVSERCPYCGYLSPVVHVHGHGQCAHCGANVEPCCGGADAADEAAATPGVHAEAEPGLFARVFAQLGGVKATVTTDALLFALTQRLGTDLDDARLMLEAGERVGLVQSAGANCHRLPTESRGMA